MRTVPLRPASVIAEVLNQRGYRTRKGVCWSEQTIDWLLRDPSAKGLHRKNYIQSNGPTVPWSFKPESEIVHAPVQALVSAEVWDKAHAILMDGKRARSRPAKRSEHLFTGVAVCECGRRMYLRHGTPSYICSSVGGCGNRVKRTTLESAAEGVLTQRLSDVAWATSYVVKAKALLQEKQARLSELEAEQTLAQETIRKAFDLVVQGQMPHSRYQIICEPHEKRLPAAREEAALLRTEIEVLGSPKVTTEAVLSETSEIAKQWLTSNLANRRSTLEAMEFRITVTKRNGISVELQYFPYSEKLSNYPRTLPRSVGGGARMHGGAASRFATIHYSLFITHPLTSAHDRHAGRQ
jgi:site-specific DNA recombinase